MSFFKEAQTMTPIVQIFYEKYKDRIFKKGVDPERLWQIWKCVPLSHLHDFMDSLQLSGFNLNKDREEYAYSDVDCML